MRRDFLFGIGLLASAAVCAGSALAADMPVRPPPPVAAPATCCAVPEWTGFYVGIHGGGGWGHTSFDPSESLIGGDALFVTSVPPGPNATPKGGVFGFQFGHNWQWGPVVGGLEIDFSGADIKETTTFVSPSETTRGTALFAVAPLGVAVTRDTKIDELASARGRLGYLILPNWLLYGTAGIGWGHERINTTSTVLTTNVGLTAGDLFFQNNDFNKFGWVAGVGLEWKFWPGSNSWLLRGEWLHYDFGRSGRDNFNTTIVGVPVVLDNGNVRTTVDVARAALSYKF